MTMFSQAGDAFIPTEGRGSYLDSLPGGNYIVVSPMMGPMYFQRVENFPEPPRLYGNVMQRAERIMQTFLDREGRSTGVLLEGEKGSGKSQLARVVANLGVNSGMPVILINSPFTGDAFNNLLASVEDPAIIIMDEFEKVYRDQEHQEAILTLLDGVMTTQKLFIFTVNNKYKVNDNMKNRPGRLFYSIEFNGLEAEFIREYCEENLENQDNLHSVLTVSAMFYRFNFDMLKAMVEEMNRYNETALQVIELLNAKPISVSADATYELVVTTKTGKKSVPQEVKEIPISGGVSRGEAVGLYVQFEGAPDTEDTDEGDAILADWERELLGAEPVGSIYGKGNMHIVVEPKHLIDINTDLGIYKFVVNNGLTVEYTRKEKQGPAYYPGL